MIPFAFESFGSGIAFDLTVSPDTDGEALRRWRMGQARTTGQKNEMAEKKRINTAPTVRDSDDEWHPPVLVVRFRPTSTVQALSPLISPSR